MKKVLAIAPYPYLPYFSGGQKFIAQFYEWLGKEVDLTVISTRNNESGLARGYRFLPWLRNERSRYYDTSLTRKISELIQKEGFDTVIWEHPYYAWLAKRIKKRTGIFTIIHTHNIEFQRFRSMGKWWWPFLRNYERKAFQRADALFFISPGDSQFAQKEWNIPAGKCIDVPFGIDIEKNPGDRPLSRKWVVEKHGLDPNDYILFFNGLLDYKPNLDAVKNIIAFVNPVLQARGFRYRVLVAGKNLPEKIFESLNPALTSNIIFTGFVEDIASYYKAADVFLNPVLSGGGIKTKMVEAIAYGTTVVAYETGANGIRQDVCGEKLVVARDNDYQSFADAVINHCGKITSTPVEYYQYYFWGNIIRNLRASLGVSK